MYAGSALNFRVNRLKLHLQPERGLHPAQHFLKREGKFFIRVFPDKPISKKPLETRMGTGKAEVEYWAARVKKGTILFEIAGVSEASAKAAPEAKAEKPAAPKPEAEKSEEK